MDLEYKNNLEKAILNLIAFFALFDYPLTTFEVWKYIGVKCNLNDLIEILEQFSKNTLCSKNGFYFLSGTDSLIEKRKEKYNFTDQKFKKALRVGKIFKFIPWIKGIAIGNIIGAHNLKAEGDIDFFIITDKNRIWAVRFLCVLIIKMLGLRPKQNNIKDKICLSFFISEDKLNLEDLMLKEEKDIEDIYFVYWLAGLVPIYDSGNIFQIFFEKNNWLKNYLPNWKANKVHFKRDLGRSFNFISFKVFGNLFNKIVRSIQYKVMPKELIKAMNQDTCVIINDNIVKTHTKDRREEYRRKYIDKILNLNES